MKNRIEAYSKKELTEKVHALIELDMSFRVERQEYNNESTFSYNTINYVGVEIRKLPEYIITILDGDENKNESN